MSWKLFLDDERYPPDDSRDWVVARNFDDAVWFVEHYGFPAYISFDHDLGSEGNRTGMDFAKWFINHAEDVMLQHGGSFTFPDFYVHSQNPVGAENIESYMINAYRYFDENYDVY